ncbi:aspartate aminotransferase family protein [Thermodesulfobacteriota bacterium]
MKNSKGKEAAIDIFRRHVSSGKANFFQNYGMDLVMGDRDGPYLADMDGEKRLFNLHCNGGVFNLGHRNRELIDVFTEALGEIDIGNHHLLSRERALLAQAISERMPGDLTYTIFGVSGGEAVDLAIRIARGATKRTKIISAKGGYHGHTGLAIAAGDEKYYAPFGPSAPGFVQVPFGDVEALAGEAGDDTAAVIVETVPATLGVVIPPEGYFESVRRVCDDRGVLLILDEIQTGLGRTGKLWGFEHFDIVPDIVVLGKGLSGGVCPITATVIREPLEAVFHEDPFIHVSTFGGAETACRVAKRVLEISSADGFLDHVNGLADAFAREIGRLMEKHSGYLTGFRQLGLMMGLVTKDELAGPILSKTAFDNDLLMVFCGNDMSVCQCLPPLVMELEMVEGVMTRLDKAIEEAALMREMLGDDWSIF